MSDGEGLHQHCVGWTCTHMHAQDLYSCLCQWVWVWIGCPDTSTCAFEALIR